MQGIPETRIPRFYFRDSGATLTLIFSKRTIHDAPGLVSPSWPYSSCIKMYGEHDRSTNIRLKDRQYLVPRAYDVKFNIPSSISAKP